MTACLPCHRPELIIMFDRSLLAKLSRCAWKVLNGLSFTGKFDESLEDYIEVPSDIVPFERRPWMKAAEITDKVVEAIRGGGYDFIRLNYANKKLLQNGIFIIDGLI